ncbi:MAG: ISNCY family transposase, partial [Bacillota bacterium]|nr:ISNCY family transposase [Bacillota bacterium]
MLRSRNKNTDQLSLVDEWLPKSYFSLPDELEKVDKLLSDERFIEPFAKHFSRSCGRPSTPIDVYLRMMYLKRRYGLGYERLCKEVAD